MPQENASNRSSTESVEGSSLSFKGVDDVECSHCFSLSMLSVDHGVSDNILKEASENTTGLFIDVGGDSFDSTSSCESADGWLGDSKDGVTESLS